MKRNAWRWLMVVMAGMAVAGCEDLFGSRAPARDWDELIPRLLGPVKKNLTPEQAATAMFDVTSPDERRDAIAYLETRSYGHEGPYMKAYELLTTDPHPTVRAQAMRALGSSKQAEAGLYLIKGLADGDAEVRRDAALGLTVTWSDEASLPLAKVVKGDPDEQARIFGAKALGRTKEPQALRALIDALGDRDAAVVKYAAESLGAATGKNFLYDTRAWLAWYQETYVMPATLPVPATGPAGGGGVVAPGGGGGIAPGAGTRP